MAQCKYCIIKSTSVTGSGTIITVNFPDVTTINNRDVLVFRVCQNLPAGTTNTSTVNFVVNGVTFKLLMQNGNNVVASQIKKCRTYVVMVGAETPTMVVKNYLPCSGVAYKSFPPPAPTTPATPTVAAEPTIITGGA